MENFTIKGRYKKENGNIQLFNTGSTISLDVKGNYVTFELGSLKKPCYIYIIKDFDYNQKKKYFVDVNLCIRLNLLDDKPHHIDLVKANESMDNTLVVKKVEIDGEILKSSGKTAKFVKVYGDSTIAGYGILAHEGVPDIDTNDGVEDFCLRALYNLKYDYDIFAASGWGLTFSAYTNPKEIGIEKYRENLCVNSDEKWVSKKADLLIISLGTNDYAYINENFSQKDELEAKFVNSYAEFIKKERENNPSLPVLMVYGSLKEEFVYSLIEKTYAVLSKRFDNIYIVKLPGDNTGLSFHSFVSTHEQMAKILQEKILSIIQ